MNNHTLLSTFFLILLLVVGCTQKRNNFICVTTPCIVDSVYLQSTSSIEFDRKYWLVTDCGRFSINLSLTHLNKGDTVVVLHVKQSDK